MPCIPSKLAYTGSSCQDACSLSSTDSFYSDSSPLVVGTKLYSDSICSTKVGAGYFSDYTQGGTSCYQTDSDGVIIAVSTCFVTPTPTPTVTQTPTNSITPTQTPTNTRTNTPTMSNTPTNSVTPTATRTPTKTSTPTNTQTNTQTSTTTQTPTNTPTNTTTRTQTPTNTPTNTTTRTQTPTNTVTPSITPTNTVTPSITPSGLAQVQFRSCEDGSNIFRFAGNGIPTTTGNTYLISGSGEFEGCATIVDYTGAGELFEANGVTFTLVSNCFSEICPRTSIQSAVLYRCSDGATFYFNVDSDTAFLGATYTNNGVCYSFLQFGGPGGTYLGSPSFISCNDCIPTPTPTRTPRQTPTVTPTPSPTPEPCPYSGFCLNTTFPSISGYSGTYVPTGDSLNGRPTYSGGTSQIGSIIFNGNEWCLVPSGGTTCILSGKYPCYSNCPDLDSHIFTVGNCSGETPTVDCSTFDFSAYFDCQFEPTPTPSAPVPAQNVDFDFTYDFVTPTPSNSPVYVVGMNFSIFNASQTPTPTLTPTPTSTPANKVGVSGRVSFEYLDPTLDCPTTKVLVDVKTLTEYYTSDNLIYNTIDLLPGVYFYGTINSDNGGVISACFEYNRNDSNLSSNSNVLQIDRIFGDISGCLPPTQTPTPTTTMTPTNTKTPTQTKTPTPTNTKTPTQTPTTTPQLESFTMRANGLTSLRFGTWYNEAYSTVVEWGDSTTDTYSFGVRTNQVGHTYSTPYTGDITFKTLDLSRINTISITTTITGDTTSGLTFTTSEMSKLDGLKILTFGTPSDPTTANSGNAYISGITSQLPRSLTSLSTNKNNLSGNVSQLPTGLTFTFIWGTNTLSGNSLGLPRPNAITYLAILGDNAISGNVSGLPQSSNLSILSITGENTLSGNTRDLPRNLTFCTIWGNNTITGNVADTPRTITSTLSIEGNNTITGDTSGLPSSSTGVSIRGNGSIRGLVSNIPSTVRNLYLYGTSGISGFTSNFSTNMVEISLLGAFNAISGNTSDLAIMTSLATFQITGGTSNIGGNISNIPNSIISFALYEGNTISGNTTSLTSKTRLRNISLFGDNTVTGSLSDFPTNSLASISFGGNNRITGYTSGYNWFNTMSAVKITNDISTYGFSLTAVDNILIDLSSKNWTGDKLIELEYEGATVPPTSAAGIAAYNTLTGKSVTISFVT